MKDNLPKKIRRNESGIINLDTNTGKGTHWTCYIKNNNIVTYFDSYGNLRPPKELVKYFLSDSHVTNIHYNYTPFQRNSYICGHLCLAFLYNLT